MTTPPERPEPSGGGPTPGGPAAPPPEPPPTLGPSGPSGPSGPAAEQPRQTFEQRSDDFGRRIEEGAEAFGKRAEALGHEAEAAAQRWSSSPVVKETADAAGRLWGLVLLAVGIWFLADVTLRLDMPSVAWRDLWPLALIVFGGFIVLKGMTRRA